MKEFLKNKTVTYNLMSFTGFKSLLLFSLLVESPKSYQEIRDYMSKHPYLRENISIDTIRVYLNSLKRIGCEVTRIREPGSRVSKYTILTNPFKINVSNEQLSSIIKTYRNIAKTITIHELLIIERFLRKIVRYINNENALELIEKKSVLKGINLDFLSMLVEHADSQNQIIIEYNSPNSGKKFIELLAQRVEYLNNTFYLYGTSLEHSSFSSFLVSRILGIPQVKKNKTISADLKEITVGFELNTHSGCEPDGSEKVIGVENGKLLLEITSSNTFDITQRLLAFGPDCKILYPQEFKDEFVKTLKQMRQGYDG
jgi:hypothetical protein